MDYRRSAALPLVLMAMLGGCTSGDGHPGVATAGRAPGTATTVPSDDPVTRELAFVACMRKEGVDMPDPVAGDKSGRSALAQAEAQRMNLKDAYQTALDVCAAYLPPGPKTPAPDPADVDRLRKYSQCMRDNGVKDFPDPDSNGQVNGWILQSDKTAQVAAEKCNNLLPPPPPTGPSAGPTR
jgi:hypothetical protein